MLRTFIRRWKNLFHYQYDTATSSNIIELKVKTARVYCQNTIRLTTKSLRQRIYALRKLRKQNFINTCVYKNKLANGVAGKRRLNIDCSCWTMRNSCIGINSTKSKDLRTLVLHSIIIQCRDYFLSITEKDFDCR